MKIIHSLLLISAMTWAQVPATKTGTPATAAKAAVPAAKAGTAATKTGTAATTAKAAPAAAKAAPAAAKSAPAAASVAKAAPKAAAINLMNPATLTARAPEVFEAKFNTTKGAFTIEVTRAWAPNGADHFYNLIRAGYYTDAGFFRVVPGFMVQFGISARPEVSRIWADRKMPDDLVTQSNTRGFVTYAQTSLPNSRSTQLFVNFGNNSFLDKQRFAPFGKVTEGMDVVDSIYSGYGEQPDQGRITAEGKKYLDANYPKLDRILTATIAPAAPAAPAAAKPEAK